MKNLTKEKKWINFHQKLSELKQRIFFFVQKNQLFYLFVLKNINKLLYSSGIFSNSSINIAFIFKS